MKELIDQFQDTDMKSNIPLNHLIPRLIELREAGHPLTLLAVCPNSIAVLEAAVKAAAENHSVMLFAATLNQVDRDGGYTGWTQAQFVNEMRRFAEKYRWDGPLYPCLDHGGPWLKDRHTLDRLTYPQTEAEVKESLTACLLAGYALLHIDTTVDRTLAADEAPSIEVVVARAVELIAHVEQERQQRGLPPVAYEAGSDEVHGGLVEFSRFEQFLALLKVGLQERGLSHIWPAFLVTQVGTDLHTTRFDAEVASRLFEAVKPYGSLIKGHYTDWVENPAMYPLTGMGGANVGPEFTSAEYLALQDLCAKEQALVHTRGVKPSQFMEHLEQAVIDSGRWKKWLLPDEGGRQFRDLSKHRREWLAQTGARYIWTQPSVAQARAHLYENLSLVYPDPHNLVVDRIQQVIDHYIVAFNLFDSVTMLS